MKNNRQYETMLRAAVEKLAGREPEDIAAKCNIGYDPAAQVFSFTVLGTETTVRFPDYGISPVHDMWSVLSILQYMAEADGTPLAGTYMGLNEFPTGGLARGSSFDREFDRFVSRGIGKSSLETLRSAIRSAGGSLIPGKGDITARFSFMPNFPMIMNLWLEDDEFPAGCKILFDRNAEHYLKVEAAGSIGLILLQRIEELMS